METNELPLIEDIEEFSDEMSEELENGKGDEE